MNIGEIVAKITADSSQFISGVDKAEDAANRLQSTFAALSFGAFLKHAADVSDAMTGMTGDIERMFGEAGDSINKFTAQASTDFGIAEIEIKKGAMSIGNAFSSIGIDEATSAKLTKQLSVVSANMAKAFDGANVEGTSAALSAALFGQTKAIRQYGVLLDDASIEQEALSLGIQKTVKEMNEQERAVATAMAVMKKSSGIAGEATSGFDEIGNAVMRTRSELEKISVQVGDQLRAPMVAIADTVTAGAKAFGEFNRALDGWPAKLAAVAAGFFAIKAAAAAAGVSIAPIVAPIAAAVIGIEALTAAFAVMFSGGKNPTTAFDALAIAIQDVASGAVSASSTVANFLLGLSEGLASIFRAIGMDTLANNISDGVEIMRRELDETETSAQMARNELDKTAVTISKVGEEAKKTARDVAGINGAMRSLGESAAAAIESQRGSAFGGIFAAVQEANKALEELGSKQGVSPDTLAAGKDLAAVKLEIELGKILVDSAGLKNFTDIVREATDAFAALTGRDLDTAAAQLADDQSKLAAVNEAMRKSQEESARIYEQITKEREDGAAREAAAIQKTIDARNAEIDAIVAEVATRSDALSSGVVNTLSTGQLNAGELTGAAAGVAGAAAGAMIGISPAIGGKIGDVIGQFVGDKLEGGGIFDALQSGLSRAIDGIADGLVSLFESIRPAVEYTGKMLSIVGKAIGGVLGALSPVIEALMEPIAIIGDLFAATLAPILKAVVPLLSAVAKLLQPLIPILIALFAPIITVIQALEHFGLVTKAVNFVADILARVVAVLSFAFNAATLGIYKFLDGLTSGIASLIGSIPGMEAFADEIQKLANGFNKEAIKAQKAMAQSANIIVNGANANDKALESKHDEIRARQEAARLALETENVADKFEALAETIENATSDFKVEGYRFAAQSGLTAGGATSLPNGGLVINVGTMMLAPSDTAEFAREVEQISSRKNFTLNSSTARNARPWIGRA